MSKSTQIALSEKLVARFLAHPRQNLIDGKWLDAQSGQTFATYNPANGLIIGHAAASDKADVDLAVIAARKAFERSSWRRTTPADRGMLMWKLADLIETNADELSTIETLDNGKPLKAARMRDIAGSIEKLRYYAGWATKLSGATLDVSLPGEFHTYTLREPVGVCGLIVPWNGPLLMAVSKIAPALAAGCTMVLKPAEQTPLSAARLGELIQEAGFPDGVVNIVNGFGATAGAALVEHPDVDKISFTGSSTTGKSILRAAAGTMKRVSLELGGKSPVLVFPDAELPSTIKAAAHTIFWNTGQVCSAGTRLFVHEKLYEPVLEGIIARAEQIKVGSGFDPETEMGPVVSKQQLDRVEGYIKAGVRDGACIRTGGEKIEGNGYFVQPTVLTGTTADMSVRREEIFGPVLCAMSFQEEDLDAIAAAANDTIYGLSAQVYTRDLSTAHKMARAIKAGTVRVNGGSNDHNLPSGGYKQSGWGRENGREGVEAFTELKSVIIAL